MIRSKFKLLGISFFVTSALFALCGTVLKPQEASALSGSQFNASNIIDDGVFFNPGGMSVGEIQNFLNAKVPTCDTNGTQPYGGTTRAAYGASRGYPAPYTCLKNYTQATTSKSAETGLCNGYGQATQSAAQIIYDVAQTCGINPRVLIVLLQKEQSLITDDWPWSIQYRSATGYGCPDTAPCDAEYYGFFNQVYSAARQYKRYVRDAHVFNYRAGRTSYVQYNPNANCGGTNLYIGGNATAGLYNYTPYQPNAAALNNLYGEGDGCSAYGNRNFWRMYNDWFNINESIISGLPVSIVAQPDTTPYRGQVITYTFTFRNSLSVPLTLDAVGAVGRAGSLLGPNRDFGWQGPVTIAAGQTQQFTFTTTVVDTGTTYAWPAVRYQGTYVQYNNWGVALNAHNPNVSLASPLTSTNYNPVAGQTATLSATIKNNEDQPLNLSAIGIPIRYYDTYNYDTAWMTPSGPLASGATQTISGAVTFDKAGPYAAWISGVLGDQYNTFSYNLNFNVSKVTPQFSLTYTETPNANPALGEDVVVKFKLKNNSGVPITLDAVGVVGRLDNPNGRNADFGWVGPQTFSVNEEKSYTAFVKNVSELSYLYAWPAINYQGAYTQYSNWGFMMAPHTPNISITTPLTVNGGSNPVIGQASPATVTIKNNEPRAVRYSALGIPVRYYGAYNYDAVWQGAGTLAPSGQGGDSVSLSGTVTFDKSGPYSLWTSILIQGRYITIGSQKNINL